jgi:multidrug efflux pump subunit AcrA (membrane-fusion protein)
MRRVTGLLLLVFVTGFVEAEMMINQVIPVTTSQNLSSLIPVGGKVEARKSVMLSAQLPGRVVSISGQEGDFFEKGSILLSLDETELRAKRREAESQWHSANAALSNAMVQRDQVLASPGSTLNTPGGMALPGLFDQVFSGPMSSMMGKRKLRVERGASVYASGTQVTQAAQALEQIRANIEQIDTKLRDSRSIAPFDGVITDKHVEEGDTVQPGQPLLGFEDLSQLQIVADIPVKLAHVLREGDQLLARIDVNNIMTGVLVDNIFPKADPMQHTVRVELNLPQTVQSATGTYAEVFLPDPDADIESIVIVVPETAVTQRGGLPVIFVVDETRTAALRLVRLGRKLNDGRQVVDYGLAPNDLVVDKPASWLVSGSKLETGDFSASAHGNGK